MTWRVEPRTDGLVHLYHEADQAVLHFDELDAGEAWDLGDDLIIAATNFLPYDPVGFTTQPPWQLHVKVTVARRGDDSAGSVRLALVCDDHGIIEWLSFPHSLQDTLDGARVHWRQQHARKDGSTDVDVAQNAESEDGHGHTEPAEPDAAGEPEGRQAAQDHGDQVQDDREGAHGA